ncbi:Ig-like domain-containing protein [Deinococcus roseus]|uniref:Bacterial Ig-like domain-containing protein n=1 Tax=Deinococcus roseus TaxID=392414 RepID=A0ABQ2CTL8_9DEIO|nr:Ig-like domain-containing protein [Deinococcus roseus]GGJ18173.1 hypothetical protein GCM10008938_00380 [Deinococcus roseus]
MKKLPFFPGWFALCCTGILLNACAPSGPAPDKTPPSVTLNASSTAVTTAGPVKLTAVATDNVGVQKVEFYEGASKLGEDTTAPYELNLNFTKANNGEHTYTAKVFDTSSNTGNSGAVKVNVNIVDLDSTPPAVTVMASDTYVDALQNVTIKAEASDNVAVQKVEFYEGDVLLSSDATAPYTLSLDYTQTSNGKHTYTAKAIDTAGNFAQATVVVQVTISANAFLQLTAKAVILSPGATTLISSSLQDVDVVLEGPGTLKATETPGAFEYTAPTGVTSATATIKATFRKQPSITSTLQVFTTTNQGVVFRVNNVLVEQEDQTRVFARLLQLTPDSCVSPWKVASGKGSIDVYGIFTAPGDATGMVTLEYTCGTVKGYVSLEVVPDSGYRESMNVDWNRFVEDVLYWSEHPGYKVTLPITSTVGIKEVEIKVLETGKVFPFEYKGGVWSGEVNLKDQPSGELHLQGKITDDAGHQRIWKARLFHNPKPVLSHLSYDPTMRLSTSGPMHMVATCTDESGPCKLEVIAEDGKVLAAGVNALDAMVQVPGPLREHEVYSLLTVKATDLHGNIAAVDYEVQLTNPSYQMTHLFSGRVFDMDADRVLYEDYQHGKALVLLNTKTGQQIKVSFPEGAYLTDTDQADTGFDARLTDTGAVYRAVMPGSFAALYDIRFPDQPITGPVFYFQAVGQFVLWSSDAGVFRKNLTTGEVTQIEVNLESWYMTDDGRNLAANGVVTWMGTDGQLYQFDQSLNKLTQVANRMVLHQENNGTSVVFTLGTSYLRSTLENRNGQEQVLSPEVSNSLGSWEEAEYALNDQHLAYLDPDASNIKQVWLRGPDGIRRKITNATANTNVKILAVNENGEVLTQQNGFYSLKFVVLDREGKVLLTRDPPFSGTLLEERIKFFDGKWNFIFQNGIYQMN